MTAAAGDGLVGEDTFADLPDAEVETVLALIESECGYDFRGYQRVFVRRRLRAILSRLQVPDLTTLGEQIRSNPELITLVVDTMSISVTEMFRDPQLFLALREHIVPSLATYPFVRIWIAGCATGEEAFSLSILLHEVGLEGRFQIYATDIHERALTRARAGVLPVATMQTNTRNYQAAGGTQAFSSYYTAGHGIAILGRRWREPILFSQHDLVRSTSFNEFQLIMCRNVMIYFDQELRARVHDLLYESLVPFGFLVLGQKEALRFSAHDSQYQTVDAADKIYKKLS